MRFPYKLGLCVQHADLIIVRGGRGIPFRLPAGKTIGTAQLTGKKRTPFSKNKIFKRVHFYEFHTVMIS